MEFRVSIILISSIEHLRMVAHQIQYQNLVRCCQLFGSRVMSIDRAVVGRGVAVEELLYLSRDTMLHVPRPVSGVFS